MPARVSEAIVLRTYPLKEADLVVSFFTREQGELRGVAKRARRVKSAFGSGLERLSQVRMAYFQRENRELVNLDSCELIQSQFRLAADYRAGIALDFMAEVTEQMLPAGRAERALFPAAADGAGASARRAAGQRLAGATYFALVGGAAFGISAGAKVCLSCGTWLDDPEAPERAFFSRDQYRGSVPALPCHGGDREAVGN